MKKLLKAVSIVSTLLLLAGGTFTSCAEDDDGEVVTPGKPNPAPVDPEPEEKEPIDLSSYYKEYFFGGSAEDATVRSKTEDWGSHATLTPNQDGTLSIQSGTGWVDPVACTAYGNIPAGYFARYEYIVVTADFTEFTLSTGNKANDGANIKLASPDEMKKLASYKSTNADGTVTYFLPVKDCSSAVTATQIALIFGGSGTIKFTEFFVASEAKPAVDFSILTAAIDAANEAAGAAVVGEEAGNYTQEVLDAFKAAITEAQAVAGNSDATQKEVDDATDALAEAKKTFEDSANVAADALPSSLAEIENTPSHVVFSSTLNSDVLVADWNQGWGGSATWTDYPVTVDGEEKTVRKLTSTGWFGLADFKANEANISTAANGEAHVFMHIDLYTNAAVEVKPVVSIGNGGAGEKLVSTEAGEYGWKGIDVDLTKINSSADAFFFQLGFGPMTNVYVDNLYIYEKELAVDPNAAPSAPAGEISNTVKALYFSSTGNENAVTTNFGEAWWNFTETSDYEISDGVFVKKISFSGENASCGWVGESEVTDNTYLHAEVYTNSEFQIKPIDETEGDAPGYVRSVPASEYGWHSVDFPVKKGKVSYNWTGNLIKIGFISPSGDTLYVDNVYTYEKEGNSADDPAVSDWDAYDYLHSDGARHENQYKAKGDVKEIVSIQKPGWDGVTEDGIYINSKAGVSGCSLGSDKTEFFIQGAGILVYLSNFTAKETSFTITDAEGTYTVVVLNEQGSEE